MKQFNK